MEKMKIMKNKKKKIITFYQIIKTLMNLKIMNFQQEMLLKLFFTKQAPEKV